MNRVLVVEDEQHLADGLRFNLEAEGYEVEVAGTGEAAQDLIASGAPAFDVIILDVMLPGKDGFALLSEMRRARQLTPTLILTARGHPGDVLQGFEAGADDYLTKPFELAILLARVRALLRRRDWLRSAQSAPGAPAEPAGSFTFGENSILWNSLELRVRDRVYPLTLMEMNVLRYMVAHEGEVVSRESMLVEVWGLHADTDTRPIDNFIVRLRRHIEEDPAHPRHLLTVRGVGYKFVASPDRRQR